MDLWPVLYAVMAFMLIGAIIAVETRDLLSSVLCVGAVGLGLALVDLLVLAPDLALTQLVVDIFGVVLLIRMVVAREDTTREFVSDTFHVAFVGGLMVALMLVSWYCFKELRPFGYPLFGDPAMKAMGWQYLVQGEATGAANRVTAVILDFRGYDTLGEATIIFAAILGCYALLRTKGKHAGTSGESVMR